MNTFDDEVTAEAKIDYQDETFPNVFAYLIYCLVISHSRN